MKPVSDVIKENENLQERLATAMQNLQKVLSEVVDGNAEMAIVFHKEHKPGENCTGFNTISEMDPVSASKFLWLGLGSLQRIIAENSVPMQVTTGDTPEPNTPPPRKLQ